MRELDIDLDPEREKIEKSIKLFETLAWIAIGLAVSSILYLGYINFFVAPSHLSLNETGTYFGGVAGALFALAGVFLVYIAFLGQRLQMLYQQQELRDNRDEMRKSTAQLKEQAGALKEQIEKIDREHLDNTFFRMLEQHFKTRDRVFYFDHNDSTIGIYELNNKRFFGEEAFEKYFDHLKIWANNSSEDGWHNRLDGDFPDKFRETNLFSYQPNPSPGRVFNDQGKVDDNIHEGIQFCFYSVRW